MIHESQFDIRTYHTDAFGHVNNARHLELLEEARWQYSESIGLTPLLRERGLGFIIMDMRLRFRQPVLEGDRVLIHTSLITLGSASGEVEQIMCRGKQVVLKSLFHFILVDRQTTKSVPIDGDIRTLLLDVIESK